MSVNVKFLRILDDKREMGAKGFQILVFVFQLVFVFGTFPDTDVTGLVVVLTVRLSSFDQAMQWKSGVWAVLTIALWIFFDIAGSEERFFKSLVWILCFNMIRGLIWVAEIPNVSNEAQLMVYPMSGQDSELTLHSGALPEIFRGNVLAIFLLHRAMLSSTPCLTDIPSICHSFSLEWRGNHDNRSLFADQAQGKQPVGCMWSAVADRGPRSSEKLTLRLRWRR